tara:strand:- start:3229 stop:4107 length:879 start_codon:yes stop_codon:yes gene_type:complete
MNKNNLIDIVSVSKNFGDTKALDSVSFSIPENSVLGLLGPNGSGKSTLLRIVSGLIKEWEGDILFENKSTKINSKYLLNKCGFLIENPTFYEHLTAHQNLTILSRLTDNNPSKINRVLSDVDLDDTANIKVSNFSYGMKQRLGIGQAILHDPDILFLDEPSNGLDPLGIKEMNKTISNLHSRGKTIIVSTHILQDVEELCSDIIILKDGQLILNTPIDKLLTESKIISIKAENIKVLENYIKTLKNCQLVNCERNKITIQADFNIDTLIKNLPEEISITSITKDPDLSKYFK